MTPVILITGASSGIGAATARRFGREGYRVALAARRSDQLDSLAEEIRTAGGQALPVPTDVTQLDDIRSLVETVLEHFGQIDILFNNAGMGRMRWLEDLDAKDDIEMQLRTNLFGLIETTQAVLPHMIARRSGHIINMSSTAGLVATPTYSIYAASKFGIRGFSEALRREVGIYNIKVSVIYPGGVANEFRAKARIHRRTKATTPSALRLTNEQVAKAVWGLARRPRRTLVIPGVMRAAVWLNALAPGLMDWIMEKRFTEPERAEVGNGENREETV